MPSSASERKAPVIDDDSDFWNATTDDDVPAPYVPIVTKSVKPTVIKTSAKKDKDLDSVDSQATTTGTLSPPREVAAKTHVKPREADNKRRRIEPTKPTKQTESKQEVIVPETDSDDDEAFELLRSNNTKTSKKNATPATSTRQTRTTTHVQTTARAREKKDPEPSKRPEETNKPVVSSPSTPVKKKPASKRKLPPPPPEVPEDQKIFKGLVFYFSPADNVSKIRAARIAKAERYGAVWSKKLDDTVTHAILDDRISYDDLTKFLEIDHIPEHIILVREAYTPESIQRGELLDIMQSRFRVRGHKEALERLSREKASLEKQPEQPQSLQLKPDRRKPLQTPSQDAGPSVYIKDADKTVTMNAPVDASSAAAPLSPSAPPAPAADAMSTAKTDDALDEAIEASKAVAGLPLESEDEAATPDDEREIPDSDDESAKDEQPAPSFRKRKWQDTFSCMRSSTFPESDGPNAKTIAILQRMGDYYAQSKDQWRTLAYRRCISALKKQTKKISTKAEALAIPFIGVRLAEKIEEIVQTNQLQRLNSAEQEPNAESLRQFLAIYGVGLSQASKWIAQGHRSLDDIRTKVKLSRCQQIGLDHFEDFNSRIPRGEVDLHRKVVEDAIKAVAPSLQATIGGSYRRGAKDSGDVDFLITADTSTSKDSLTSLVFDTLVPYLYDQGYLKATLAGTKSKWHGAAALDDPASRWRRVDFLLVPEDEWGAALIYFTGNDIMNRSLRLLASKKGMRLNQHGLWKDVMRGPGRVKVTQGELVEAKDEKKIFEALGVPWRPPEERNH